MLQAATQILRRHGDVLLAVALTALLLAQVATVDTPGWEHVVASLSALALGATLAVRVRHPLAAPIAVLVVGLVSIPLSPAFDDLEASGLFVLLAVYSSAAHTSGWRTVVAGVLAVAIAVGAAAGDPEELNVAGAAFFAVAIGAPWLAGRIVHRRRESEARLERERDAAEARVEEERARIARELHDVVAHAISVVVLQARGGRRMLETDPNATRVALDAIERTGSQALVEMRRLVGLLRESDEQLALAPQPSIAHIGALVASVEAAGMPVELDVVGAPVQLAPGVDLSAYRIVQEALTNALKHAGPARARVRITFDAASLRVEVRDDGGGAETAAISGGHGLVGIRERVAVVGGELVAGPARDGGGFSVRAVLPYGGT